MHAVSVEEVAAYASAVAKREPRRRRMIGFTGPPGAGKSVLAQALARHLGDDPALSPLAVLPMDGFHLRNADLISRGLQERKGAPDTFDCLAFVERLLQLRQEDADVDWPEFSRVRDEPIENAIRVPASVRTVIVEGNYLLLSQPPWERVAPAFDAIIYLDVDQATLRDRLIRRQLEGGLSMDAAIRHVDDSDLLNVPVVEASRDRADQVFRISRSDPALLALKDPATGLPFTSLPVR